LAISAQAQYAEPATARHLDAAARRRLVPPLAAVISLAVVKTAKGGQ
jgi:hypothetical protein